MSKHDPTKDQRAHGAPQYGDRLQEISARSTCTDSAPDRIGEIRKHVEESLAALNLPDDELDEWLERFAKDVFVGKTLLAEIELRKLTEETLRAELDAANERVNELEPLQRETLARCHDLLDSVFIVHGYLDDLREERDTLKAAIEAAPHGAGCGAITLHIGDSSTDASIYGACDCWKAKALGESK